MKNITTFLVFITITMATAQETPIEAWQEKWKNSKNYLLEVAKAMPSEQYNYHPTEREMTFAEQLLHIANNINWLSNSYFNGEKIEKYSGITNKETIITLIETAFANAQKAIENTNPEELKQQVEFFAGTKTKLQILNLLQDHVTHHRGQLIVYLNLNNIEPPRYSGW